MKTLLALLTLIVCTSAYSQKTNTFQQLQGKWRSIEDRSNILWFDKDHRKEIGSGMNTWDDEIFVLSNSCKNTADKGGEMPPETDKYISVAAGDMCWYIERLTSTTLELSYVGRGNTLSYKKILPVKRKKK